MPKLLSLRHLLCGIFAVAMLMLAAPGSAKPAEALNNCLVGDLTFDEAEQAFLDIINQYRASYGLEPLSVSVNLNRSATWMATDLASKNYFSHRDSSGRISQDRIADCGGTPASGENLAAGTIIDSAAAAFRLWRNSPGHNRNMLYPTYTQIGIARAYNPSSRYKWYWVTTFGVPDDGTRMVTSFGMQSPKPLTQLTSTTATFQWKVGSGVDEYKLEVGSSPGAHDIYSSSLGLATRATVSNLPGFGRSVFVRLWARVADVWQYVDYAYMGTKGYQ
jgi:uncharacterized protein YkwD